MVWTTVVAPPACSSTTFGDFRPRGVLVKMAGAVVFFRNLPPHPPVLRHPDTLGRPWFGLQSSPRLLLHLHPDLRRLPERNTGWTSRSLRSRRCNLDARNLANRSLRSRRCNLGTVVAVLPACLSRCRRNRLRSILASVLLTARTLDLTSRRRRTSTRSPAILVPSHGPAK